MRRFYLQRNVDVTGISGTGLVVHGVEFPDGTVVTKWNGRISQTCLWASIEDMVDIHGHDGLTSVVWIDEVGDCD